MKPIMKPIFVGILFLPDVAFAVSCRPTETKPTEKHREGSSRSTDGKCCLGTVIKHSKLVVRQTIPSPPGQ